MPRTRRAGAPEAAPTHPAPDSSAENSTKDLRGLFKWLPAQNSLSENDYPRYIEGGELEASVYNHPVVVMSPKARADGTVIVLTMTSFGGKTLRQRYSRATKQTRRRMRAHHIPVAPAEAHPPHNIVLTAEGGLELRKPGYVKTERQVRVKLTALGDYNRWSRGQWAERLSPSSYKKLQKHVGFVPDVEAEIQWTVPVPDARPAESHARPVALPRAHVIRTYGSIAATLSSHGGGSAPSGATRHPASSATAGSDHSRTAHVLTCAGSAVLPSHHHYNNHSSASESGGFCWACARFLGRLLRACWAAVLSVSWRRVLILAIILGVFAAIAYGMDWTIRTALAALSSFVHRSGEFLARSWSKVCAFGSSALGGLRGLLGQ